MRTLCNACGLNYAREVKSHGELDLDKLKHLIGQRSLSINKSIKMLKSERIPTNILTISGSHSSRRTEDYSRPNPMSISEILCSDPDPSPKRVVPSVQNLLCE